MFAINEMMIVEPFSMFSASSKFARDNNQNLGKMPSVSADQDLALLPSRL